MLRSFFKSKAISPFLLLTTLASGGVCWGIDQIVTELSLREGRGKGSAIARLEEKKIDVRRKRANHYSWSNVEVGDFFYHRESLQTGEHSKAKLSFPKSPEKQVELSENSIIIFDENAEFGLYLLSGVMNMIDHGAEIKLAASFGTETILHNYFVKQLLPEPDAELYLRKGEKIDVAFSWKQAHKIKSSLQLEIASGANFGPLSTNADIQNLDEKNMPLAPGKYFWRLSENKKAVSPVRMLQISAVDSLTLGSVETIANNALSVSWAQPTQTVSPNKGTHFFELSEDREFKAKILRFPIEPLKGIAMIPKPANGQYFARLVSSYGKLNLASQLKTVTINNSNASLPSSPLASHLGGNSAKNLSPDQSASGKSNASRSLASDIGAGSNASITEEDTAKIAKANTDPSRFQFSTLQQPKNILLSWAYPDAAGIDHWELWLVDKAGNPTTKLVDTIPPSWRAYNLDINAVKAGDFFELIGKDPAADVYSEIVSYAVSNEPPPAPQNLKLKVLINAGITPGTFYGQVELYWDYSSLADGFRVRGDFQDGMQGVIITQLPGNERSAQLQLDYGKAPLLKITMQALRSSGGQTLYSTPITSTYCVADINGDGIIDQNDINLVQANFGAAPAQWDLTFSYHSPYDLNWDRRIDSTDVAIVNNFLGKSCNVSP